MLAEGITMDIDSMNIGIKYYHSIPLPAEPVWYGLDRALRDWLDMPQSIPVLMDMHHGPDTYVAALPFYLASPAPLLVGREESRALYVDGHGKVAYVMGTPYVHHRRQQGIQPAPSARGTLAFPAHSTHHNHARFDVDRYIDLLMSLPEPFHPIEVCLYWKDILDGNLEHYRSRGINVHTAGHMFDPLFCTRFYDILRRFRYATANMIVGTHSVLALEMGLPFFALGPAAQYEYVGSDPNLDGSYRGEEHWVDVTCTDPVTKEFYKLVPRWTPGMEPSNVAPSQRLLELASIMHGCDAPLDKAMLRRVIFARYVETNRWGACKLRCVLENPAILHTPNLESVFGASPDMVEFVRFVARYPDVLPLASPTQPIMS
nr:hypothetical protein [Azospirillum argentinense]